MKRLPTIIFILGSIVFLVIAVYPSIPRRLDPNAVSVATSSIADLSGEKISMETVALNNNEESCYTVINGQVYDVTSAITSHPGGKFAILKMCGVDSTERFTKKHGESEKAKTGLEDLYIGDLE